MKLQIEKWERWFLYATTVMLVAFLVAIFASIGEAGIHLPTDEDQVDFTAMADPDIPDPAPFDTPGVFASSKAGVDFEVVIVASAWFFTPATIEIPAGSTVEFVMTSSDTIHGFLLAEYALNGMVIPGQITKVTAELDEPGTYNFICHEFCGTNHHNMFGVLEVIG